jgi:hypothetical protein
VRVREGKWYYTHFAPSGSAAWCKSCLPNLAGKIFFKQIATSHLAFTQLPFQHDLATRKTTRGVVEFYY